MLFFERTINLTTSINGLVYNNYAPLALTINPSNLVVNGKIYDIEYIFPDETLHQTYFYSTSSNSTLPRPNDIGDPRNYKLNKNLFLPYNKITHNYQISANIHQIGYSDPTQIIFNLNLNAPKLDGLVSPYFDKVHLTNTRIFGVENHILYVFETENPNYYIPFITNWENRPTPTPTPTPTKMYRPYKIFEPYEDQRLTNGYEHIDFYNQQDVYDKDETSPNCKPDWVVFETPIPTVTPTPTPTRTPIPTNTPTPTPTRTPNPTNSPTPTPSRTPIPTNTPTRTPIPTPTPTSTPTPTPTPTSTAIVFLADYIVITYQFDSTNGLDLDSKTKLIAPIQSDIVGFCKSNDASPYLYWGGDNQGSGVESAYVDLTQFNANAVVQINCGGVWYNQRLNGNMSIDIRAYLGGTMVLNGYGFQNVGGTQTNFTSFAGNIALQTDVCSDGQTVGIISYNKATNQLTFTPS
jgi:hypothetical protein